MLVKNSLLNRILFEFLDKNKILLFDIGTREIYK